MATVDWPSSLPDNLLVDGYQETPPDLLIRTEMEEGPGKIRRWGTGNVREITGELILDLSEVDTLDDFYLNTLKGGALRFNWNDPRSGDSVEMRFREQPEYSGLSGNIFRARLRLEIMP